MPPQEPRQDRVTIADVARYAGVSTMTVSNVFNGKGKVAPATRERVMQAIATLGYRPDPMALRLKGTAIARIGLIHYDVESMFISGAIAAIAIAAAERGLQLLIRKSKGVSRDEALALADELVRAGAQALLLIPPYAELLCDGDGKAPNVPMVALATATPLAGMSTVRIDNFAANVALTEHLIARGCKRIGVATGPLNHSDSVARLDGYRAALEQHGLGFDPALCRHGHFTFASGVEIGDDLLNRAERPDAIVAANDDMAAGILWVAHRMGIDVPGQVAITGFDDTLLATRVWPSLTTVRQPVNDMAGLALDLALEARGRDDGVDRLVPFTLIERGSS